MRSHLISGDRAASRRAAAREGIPLDESMIEKLEGIARDTGVAGILAG